MYYINNLQNLLQQHFQYNKARLRFMTLFIVSLIKVKTVRLTDISLSLNHKAKKESNYRRIQNFFKDFLVNYEDIARFIISCLPKDMEFIVTLDRTNWLFGKSNINILMLAIVYKSMSIPLFWKLLNKRGNSSLQERKEIVSKAIKLLGSGRIRSLVADREFDSGGFFRFLKKEKIVFHIRLKKTAVVKRYKATLQTVTSFFDGLKPNTYIAIPQKKIIYNEEVYISGEKQNNGDYFILASNDKAEEASGDFDQRWTIESMFGHMKSKGFDFEETHMTDLEKIEKLIALMAIAFLWSYLVGLWMNESLPIKIKNNGRKEISIFRKGLDHLRYIFLCHRILFHEFNSILKILSCAEIRLICTRQNSFIKHFLKLIVL